MAISRRKLFPHKVSVGTQSFICQLPDLYSGTGSTTGTALGVTKLADNYEYLDDDVVMDVNDGLRTGKFLRVRVTYVDTTITPPVKKSSKLICSLDKAKTCISALKSKTIEGFNITSAGFPTRRRLY